MARTLAEAYVAIRGNTLLLKRDVEKGAAEAGTTAGKAFSTALIVSGAVAVGVGVLLEKSIKAAGDFQASMVRLTTSANETGTATSGNLKLVSDGILAMAGPLATSVTALSKAMYTVESGGFHGAAGLLVLKAAAQGAKAENADLTTVTDAVTSALTDYHLSADQSAYVTTKLVATTAAGKTTFEQLAGSLHSVLPAASAAHISLDDILGDLASMTLHGISADQATQNLTDVIRHMQAPTAVQAKELSLLGLTTNQLASDLKSKGLSGTLGEISDRIVKLMPPGTDKVIGDLRTSLGSLSPAVRELGDRLVAGTISAREYRVESMKMDPISRSQASSFAALAGSTHRIGDEQVSGAQVLQTYGGALQKATGDATGMNVALMLTGENAGVTTGAIRSIGAASTEAGGNVKGWSDIQGTFNFKLGALKATAESTGIQLGTQLLPIVGHLVDAIKDMVTRLGDAVTWLGKHGTAVKTAAIVIGSLTTAVLLYNATVAISALATSGWAVAMGAIAFVKLIGSVRSLRDAMVLLDLAMDANPIGLIVVAIAALVAGVLYCWFHFRGFRVFLIDTWLRLKEGALEWWHSMVTVFNDVSAWCLKVGRSFMDFMHTVENAWHNIEHWTDDARIFVVHVFNDIGHWLTVSLPHAWSVLTANIADAWHNIQHWTDNARVFLVNIFNDIGHWLTVSLPHAFSAGVAAIGNAWDALRAKAREPIAFVVNSVINPLIGGFNRVAGAFGLHPNLSPIGGFDTGGYTGPGGKHEPAGVVHRDEYVIPKEVVKQLGVPFFDALIGRGGGSSRLSQFPGDGSQGIVLPGYADGGLVGFLKDVWGAVSDPAKLIRGPAEAALSKIPGGGAIKDMAGGAGRTLLGGLLDWVKSQASKFFGSSSGLSSSQMAALAAAGGSAAAAMSMLRAQIGKPYGWAMAGPGAFDCSGLISAVWNVLHGRAPFSHTFSTSNEAGFFPIGGIGGILSAGWTNPGESGVGGGPGGVGHTAGILAGMPFESTGSQGVHWGSGVTPLGRFAHIGHFDSGGAWPSGTLGYNGSGRTEHVATGQAMDAVVDRLERLIAAVERVAPGVGNEINRTGRSVVQVARAH
jgi:TP901 family phage tail tape measure protein